MYEYLKRVVFNKVVSKKVLLEGTIKILTTWLFHNIVF